MVNPSNHNSLSPALMELRWQTEGTKEDMGLPNKTTAKLPLNSLYLDIKILQPEWRQKP